METNDKKTLGILVFLALLGIFLVDEYAHQYLIPLIVIYITFPLVFFAGVYWEKIRFEGYLEFLREKGDLVDHRLEREQEKAALQAQPVRHVSPTAQAIQFNWLGTIQRRRQKLN